MSVDFTANNTAPKHVFAPQNPSVEMFFAPQAAGLTSASTSGWRRGGSLKLGSYKADYQTSVNMTKLGTTKTPQSFHINEQGATVSAEFQELTPFGQLLINKTDLTQTITANGASATIAVSGGGVTSLTLQAIGTLVANMIVGIAIGSGSSAYEDYRKITTVASNTITLDLPLDEAPADGALVRGITKIQTKRGGVNLAHRSYLGIVSHEDGVGRLTHFAADTVMTNGNNSYPDADTIGTTLEMQVIPATEVISTRKQPVLMTEELIFA